MYIKMSNLKEKEIKKLQEKIKRINETEEIEMEELREKTRKELE